MKATGTFDVILLPQDDSDHPAGRMLINKTYSGDMIGQGMGQMLSKRTENGLSVYFAVEEFNGTIAGKTGSFTLLHHGKMSATEHSLDIVVLDGSGQDALSSIAGSLEITQTEDVHHYVFDYTI